MRRSRPGPPTWWAALAGLALPVACPGCGAPDVRICAACLLVCGSPQVTDVELTAGPPGVPAVAAGAYAGPLRRLVVAWKDEGRRDLSPVLADLLAASVVTRLDQLADRFGPTRTTAWWSGLALVPAPSSRAAVRRRGEDVVAALARSAAAGLAGGIPGGVGRLPVAPVLRQRRGVADQAGLDRRARRANVEGRLVLRGRPPAAAIVVDDVLTTGATVAAATATLRAAGVAVLGVCAVSATPARHPLLVRPGLG